MQQDGAPAHFAKSTQHWWLANLLDASDWPANSPELNVLDFSIWAILEQKACQKKHTSVQALRKCLEKARNENPQDHVRAAAEAYPKRLKGVILAKEGYIEGSLVSFDNGLVVIANLRKFGFLAQIGTIWSVFALSMQIYGDPLCISDN
ncbi:hypothetical protein ANCDUO_02744 [Ancylostoma duodenale]|uniref:Uncharacterized protein n=1 Tax=Ancylostoma duodenale TaxID=51022 RepID=A0A0C2DVP3_9BILA|nr:hypothetical protein ANCDUO_02744 [Ancylostoma duodenale]